MIKGDCLTVLKDMSENSIDSLVTDPPAGISFMGKDWDGDKGGRDQWVGWMSDVMRECYRVLKPGAHGLVWALPRTSHWTATALENAGFQIRDKVLHIFGTGFPKSLNINKVLEKQNELCTCGETKVSSLQNLSDSVRPEDENGSIEIENVQLQVPRRSPKAKRTKRTTQANSAPRQSGMDGSKPAVLFEEHDRPEESGMEGRSNLQEIEGQLHRPEICAMPQRVPANGSQGRLHHGASSSDGQTYGQMPHENGSGSSQGPRHAEQSHNQPRILSQQHNAQTCRSCGKARIQPGLGTALKPAVEEWILIRKPLAEKTVAKNVLMHGTGGINIDASRISLNGEANPSITRYQSTPQKGNNGWEHSNRGANFNPDQAALGRFPANLVLSHNPDCDDECSEGCAVKELDEQSGITNRKDLRTDCKTKGFSGSEVCFGNSVAEFKKAGRVQDMGGGASRFFYCAKASKSDRGTENKHPTVKSTKLMEYLIKLVTPQGGKVLDPFMGSGSTGVACKRLGFEFVGIEKSEEYFEIAEKRINSGLGF